jgi:hypothetical protein
LLCKLGGAGKKMDDRVELRVRTHMLFEYGECIIVCVSAVYDERFADFDSERYLALKAALLRIALFISCAGAKVVEATLPYRHYFWVDGELAIAHHIKLLRNIVVRVETNRRPQKAVLLGELKRLATRSKVDTYHYAAKAALLHPLEYLCPIDIKLRKLHVTVRVKKR